MEMGSLIITLAILGTLATTSVVALSNGNGTSANNQKETTKANSVSQIKSTEGNKIAEINTTWGEFLDSYMRENPQVKYYNPRSDISKDHKVKVVKTEYPKGLESKAGFYNYALITEVYDLKTGELLTSVGDYKNNK